MDRARKTVAATNRAVDTMLKSPRMQPVVKMLSPRSGGQVYENVHEEGSLVDVDEPSAQTDDADVQLSTYANPFTDPRRPGFIPLKEVLPPYDEKEIFKYFGFLILFITATVLTKPVENSYFFGAHVRNAAHVEAFAGISNQADYEAWWGDALADGLRPWHAASLAGAADIMMVGLPRVRQVRAALTTEQVVPFMGALTPKRIKERGGKFANAGMTSNLPITDSGWGQNHSCASCRVYTYSEELDFGASLNPFSNGNFAFDAMTYPGSGFLLNTSEILAADTTWRPGFWLDDTTVAVFHDFSLYNPNTFEIAAVSLVYMRLPSGSVRTHSAVNIVRPFMRYENRLSLVVEVCFYSMLLYFIVVELLLIVSISQECKILVPMSLMILTMKRRMIQLQKTFALTAETFDPRNPREGNYNLGATRSTEEIFPGKTGIVATRAEVALLAKRMYKMRLRGEPKNEVIIEKWKARSWALECGGRIVCRPQKGGSFFIEMGCTT